MAERQDVYVYIEVNNLRTETAHRVAGVFMGHPSRNTNAIAFTHAYSGVATYFLFGAVIPLLPVPVRSICSGKKICFVVMTAVDKCTGMNAVVEWRYEHGRAPEEKMLDG